MTYHGTCDKQEEKYDLMRKVMEHGGTVTDISGYGDKYIIHFDCTDEQAAKIAGDWLFGDPNIPVVDFLPLEVS